jgi:hypothetical protein
MHASHAMDQNASLISANSSFGPASDDDLLFHCWPHFTCDTCLASPYPCSWCAISSTCVPNTLMPSPFAILSPLKSESICPLSWRERWELRAKPFSCRCSTMTLMSVVVAVLSTLTTLVAIWVLVKFLRWLIKCCRKRRERRTDDRPRWSVVWLVRGNDAESDSVNTVGEANGSGERRPLLG